MIDAINELRNTSILKVQKVHDYWQIHTDKGRINIYNPATYHTTLGKSFDLEHIHSDDIINRIIINVFIENERYLCFKLDNESAIIISLADNDYSGPEAFCIYLNTGVIIVD